MQIETERQRGSEKDSKSWAVFGSIARKYSLVDWGW